jgi:NUMOD1 domain
MPDNFVLTSYLNLDYFCDLCGAQKNILYNNYLIFNLSPLSEDYILLPSLIKLKKSSGASSKEINVLDVKTNVTIIYTSIRKAALALGVDVKSLNRHISSKCELGLNTLYKDQYLINVVLSEPKTLSSSSVPSTIDVNIYTLELNKLFVYSADKQTLVYVFDSMAKACRTLRPSRCKNLSDLDLEKRKNIQHLLRVINKGILSKTELGSFYLFKNPGYSTCLALVV